MDLSMDTAQPAWAADLWSRLLATIPREPAGMATSRANAVSNSEDAAERERFERFFYEYAPRITGYLWRMTGADHAAFDLSQETFLRAWQHFDSVGVHPQPVAWLFKVATNLALNHLRAKNTVRTFTVPLDDMSDPGRSDPALRLAERDQVQQALRTLAERPRAVLILREVYGLSCAEIGQTLGLSPIAAKTALCRAREQFRAAYLRKEERS
jgi:RNA polymerase sigma factor (sigma-70 family)